MKLLSWNLNGIRSALSKGLSQVLETEKPDLVCFQETKAQRIKLLADQQAPAGYFGYFSDAEKAGYSGVATLARNAKVKNELKATGIGHKTFDSEGRALITAHESFTLYNIYFPSGTSGETRQAFKYKFLDKVYDHFASMSQSERANCIICGDFNICHKPIDIHHPIEAEKRCLTGFLPEERKWVDTFVDLGFIDSYRFIHGEKPQSYTWWSYRANSRVKNLGWRIDYFFVGKDFKIKDAAILHTINGSDHCPITVEL